MDAVKKVLQKIRHNKPASPPLKAPKPKWLKDIELQREQKARWEMDKKINPRHRL